MCTGCTGPEIILFFSFYMHKNTTYFIFKIILNISRPHYISSLHLTSRRTRMISNLSNREIVTTIECVNSLDCGTVLPTKRGQTVGTTSILMGDHIKVFIT